MPYYPQKTLFVYRSIQKNKDKDSSERTKKSDKNNAGEKAQDSEKLGSDNGDGSKGGLKSSRTKPCIKNPLSKDSIEKSSSTDTQSPVVEAPVEKGRGPVPTAYRQEEKISLLLRVKFDYINFNLSFAYSEDTPFIKVAKEISDAADLRMSTERTRVGRSIREGGREIRNYDPTVKTKVRVFAAYMNRSLKETLIQDDEIFVQIMENGKPKEKGPMKYVVHWLQYPLDCVNVLFNPLVGYPLAALVKTETGPCLFADSHHVEPFCRGLRYFWFTMERGAGVMTRKEAKTTWIESPQGTYRPKIHGAVYEYEGAYFTPTAKHVGKYVAVAVSCTPAVRHDGDARFTGPSWTVVGRSSQAVAKEKSEDKELLMLPTVRWGYAEKNEDSFNLVFMSLAKDLAFFTRGNAMYQDAHYRYSLILKDLVGKAYSGKTADLYFLHDVCQRMASQYLPTMCEQIRYGYSYHPKSTEVLVWNDARFEKKNEWCSWLRDVQESDENQDIRDRLTNVQKIFEYRPSFVHIVQLEERTTGEMLIIGYVLLHEHPRSEYYKVLVTRELTRCVRVARGDDRTRSVRVLLGVDLCDLCKTPDSETVRDGLEKVWVADAGMGGIDEWLSAQLRRLGNTNNDSSVSSCLGHSRRSVVREERGFVGSVDSIWASGLQLVEYEKQPSVSELIRNTSVSSSIAPSD